MEPGWNIKFKKSGKTLCTIYPRELYFIVMIVVVRKEKEAVEAILPECTSRMQEIYHETKEIIQLEVRSDNTSAIHLYEKHGFQRIGTIPAYFKMENAYFDFDMMCLDLR